MTMIRNPRLRRCSLVILIAFAIGGIPAATNLALDPFQLLGWRTLDRKTADTVEKRHGPLFKAIAFDRAPRRRLILGDSRSRALRDKLFHELGETEAFNFAFSGGTVPEMVEAYGFAAARGPIDALVIGAPLRMFDRQYKNGKNQFPEAAAILSRPVNYFSSWLVFDTALETIGLRAPDPSGLIAGLLDSVAGVAFAQTPLSEAQTYGQCRAACVAAFDDQPPDWTSGFAPRPRPAAKPVARAATPAPLDDLPSSWRRQIRKAAASDWRAFVYAQDYFDAVAAIVRHAQARGTDVLFFIPPTLTAMQARIADFDRLGLALEHRRRLAELAPVLDFDFPNERTNDPALFSDAYHFNGVFAKRIVQEIVARWRPADEKLQAKIEKRRTGVRCPAPRSGERLGEACLVWTAERR